MGRNGQRWQPRLLSGRDDVANAHILFVGGEDHDLRIPFICEMRRRGYHVSAAGTGDAAPFARAGIAYYPYNLQRSASALADLRSIALLAQVFAAAKPDLIHCFDTKPNFLVPIAARRAGGIRVIRTINGMGWLYSSNSPLALALRPVYLALHRIAARFSVATVFQNREDKAFFERRRMQGTGLSRLVPGSGIDAEAFAAAAASGSSATRLREELELGTAEVVITVARLTRQKGIPTLLKAASLVHAVRPNIRFLLVGSRQSEGSLAVSEAEILAHAPYVIATGRRTDIPSLLAVGDVFAFPTEYREGVPRALLEAALAGLPIVATRMPGCTEIVDHGRSGILVPPRSPEDLAEAILGLLANRDAARAMGERAGERVRQEFGLGLTAERYARLYDEVLGKAPDTLAGDWQAQGVETTCAG